MRGHVSLKQRLLLLVLTAVIAVWLVAAGMTYYDARKEFDEVLDAHLAQTAALLTEQASHELDEIETEHVPLLHKYSRRVAFQVWEKGNLLRLHSVNAPQEHLSKTEHGFSHSMINGQHWHVFSAWDENGVYLVQVAERADVRDELASGIAVNLLRPLLVSLPLLAILLWIVVTRGLRPLENLTHEVAQRDPDNLAPLYTEAAPLEVMPLMERLNHLFARIDESIQKERRFTADAAHELRTPVAAIRAQAQVALAASADQERNRALENAILGCDRATHLIEQLLTLARVDALEGGMTQDCPLRSLAAEVIAALAPAALEKGVRLELLEGAELTVPGDPGLLRILLRNLIDNASRHTPSGTTVQIDIAEEQGVPRLSVIDNGPGIPAQDLARVSERFYRPLGTQASGSGLGLSIVRRIVEVHGATLKMEPASAERGLRVTVIFRR